MKEYKLRAYHKKQKRMFPVYGIGKDFITEDTLDGIDPGNNCFSGEDLEDIEVMRPIGTKKDITGKEIYQGDIVIWNDGRGETELNPEKGWIRKAVVKIDPDIQLQLTKDTPSGEPDYIFHYGSFIYKDTENHLKIIGNIYENPGTLIT